MAGGTGSRGSGITLAGSWDGQAVRLYVDGQLEGIRIQGGENTEWSCLPKNVEGPNGEALELILAGGGRGGRDTGFQVPAIRSLCARSAKNTPFAIGAGRIKFPSGGGGRPHLETSDKDLNAARLKNHLEAFPTHGRLCLQRRPGQAGVGRHGGDETDERLLRRRRDGVELDANQESDRPARSTGS